MIAFEVILNGDKLCIAGVEGPGVISAILSWASRATMADTENNESCSGQELTLEVGGLQSNDVGRGGTHISWLNRRLEVGDVLTIQIKNLLAVDEPAACIPQESEEVVREAK